MSNNITPEILIQYIDDELVPDERLYVEIQVAASADLQQQVNRLRLARQAFTQYALKEKIAAIHTAVMQERKQQAPKAKVRWLRSAMRVAAILLVVLVIAGIVQYSLLDADRLYSKQYEQFTLGTTRGDSGISPLEQAYRRGDMQQVITRYEQRTNAQTADHFLAGQAYLTANDPQKAVAAFDAQLTANASVDPKPYQDDAEYYLALAYLKAGNTEKALPIFERINKEGSHTYNREVSSWFLTQLRWLRSRQ